MRSLIFLLVGLATILMSNGLRMAGDFRLLLKKDEKKGLPVREGFLDYYRSKFAFTKKGVLSGYVSTTNETPINCFHMVFCDVTHSITRDSSYQRKRIILNGSDWRTDVARKTCEKASDGEKFKVGNMNCQKFNASGSSYRPANDRRAIIFIDLVGCVACLKKAKVNASGGSYNLSMFNNDQSFPQLGWDESMYPFAPTVFASLAVAVFASMVLALIVIRIRHWYIPFVAKIVFVATVLKIFSTALTTYAFWRLALTGDVTIWFFVLRVPLIIIDEILIGLLMLVMSTGVFLLPDSWMFDRRSSTTFAVFLGLALEVFTVVTSEVLYMFKWLGLVVFLFSGGTVVFICALYSWKNVSFLVKYEELIRFANIRVETTPLPRMARFFQMNSLIVIFIWLFKVVSFGVMDHAVERSDILWTLFEAADMVLLVWYAFSIFPRQNSGYYVNMSNVNNDRLNEVNSWHMRRTSNDPVDTDSDIDIVDEAGHVRRRSNAAVAEAEDDPEPPVISWRSGDPLPSPTAGMWSVPEEVRRVLKRSKPPDAIPVRVLGSPVGDEHDSLSLAIARPVLGPDTQKRPRSTDPTVIASPYADRERPDAMGDGASSRNGGFASRETSAFSDIDFEAFSVPSSSASADGEIFLAPDATGKGRRR